MTKNFAKSEFDCKCGCEMPKHVENNIKELADNLQVVRDMLGGPIRINSAYRCEAHNKDIGGTQFSQHIKGNAADIVIKDLRPEQVVVALDRMIEAGFIKQGGIGAYQTFTHYDIRGYEAKW